MTVPMIDRKLLQAIDPADAVAYLESRGWHRRAQVRRMLLWGQPGNGEQEVLLPLERRLVDFADRMHDLVLDLSEAEKRPPGSVLRDLLNARSDAIKIRVPSPGGPVGSIPLEDGVALVEGARDLLAAAASAVLEPQPRLPSRRPRKVREYLSSVRLGQTEQGSFVVSLVSPLGALPKAAAGGAQPAEPFSRLVVRTLATALQHASRTAESVAANQASPEAFAAAVLDGVSANLCEALQRVSGRRRQGFTVGFGWAPALPVQDGAVSAVHFSERALRILPEAEEFLRAMGARPEGGELRGRVVGLRRSGGRGPGRAIVQGRFNDEPLRASVELDEHAYDRAILAHREGLQVVAAGQLTRAGRSWVLTQLSRFSLIDPSSNR